MVKIFYYLAKKKRPYLDKKHFIDQKSTIDQLKHLLILGVTFLGGNDSCYSPWHRFVQQPQVLGVTAFQTFWAIFFILFFDVCNPVFGQTYLFKLNNGLLTF